MLVRKQLFVDRSLVVDKLNQELSAEILRRAAIEPSHRSWNQGGWRSGEDFLSWPLVSVTLLHEFVREAFDEIEDTRRKKWRAWCLVNQNGSHHDRHTHSGKWTGIYYVTSGSGDTLFELPGGIQRVTPEAGLLVLAPSRVFHSVAPCLGETPRITIAFEAR